MQTLMKDVIQPSLESPVLNIWKIKAFLYENYDEKEINALIWLLENAPAIEFIEVIIPPPRDVGLDEKYKQLLRRIQDCNFKRP